MSSPEYLRPCLLMIADTSDAEPCRRHDNHETHNPALSFFRPEELGHGADLQDLAEHHVLEAAHGPGIGLVVEGLERLQEVRERRLVVA